MQDERVLGLGGGQGAFLQNWCERSAQINIKANRNRKPNPAVGTTT